MGYRVIDLFSGAGGLTLGFVGEAFCGGFESVWALDNDKAAIETYKANFGDHADCGDIEARLNEMTVPSADVVVGGPPCQGFSLLNKQRTGDVRRALWEPFMDVVERSGARMFVIENVRWLLSAPEFADIAARAEKMGFGISTAVLNAADYGAPQARQRAFVMGWAKEIDGPAFPPLPSHSAPNSKPGRNLPPWRTVRDAIGDLDPPEGTVFRSEQPPLDLHFGRNPTAQSLARYQAVPPGGNRFDLQRNRPDITPACWINKRSGGTDLFGRLWWDRPSVTIRTEFFKPEKGRYLHPDQDRPITHREAARLMGFPDAFIFKGSKTEVARQIGNAVPPPLAAAIAGSVLAALVTADQGGQTPHPPTVNPTVPGASSHA